MFQNFFAKSFNRRQLNKRHNGVMIVSASLTSEPKTELCYTLADITSGSLETDCFLLTDEFRMMFLTKYWLLILTLAAQPAQFRVFIVCVVRGSDSSRSRVNKNIFEVSRAALNSRAI